MKVLFSDCCLFACSPQEQGLEVSKLSQEHKILLLQVALKSADLGHVAEDLDVHVMCVVMRVPRHKDGLTCMMGETCILA